MAGVIVSPDAAQRAILSGRADVLSAETPAFLQVRPRRSRWLRVPQVPLPRTSLLGLGRVRSLRRSRWCGSRRGPWSAGSAYPIAFHPRIGAKADS
jgi:hypothetical protein